MTVFRYPKHSNPQTTTKVSITFIGLPSFPSGGHFRCDPDFVRDRSAINRLKDQLEIESQFQFANHDDGWVTVT